MDLRDLAVAAIAESGNKSPRMAALLLKMAACVQCAPEPVVGALLILDQGSGKLGFLLGNGIASVAEAFIVPAVKSWLLTLTVKASVPRLGTALFISTTPTLSGYQAAVKIFPSIGVPAQTQVYIIDPAGNPIDPAAVQLLVGNNEFFGIQITAQLAGSDSGISP